MLANILFLTSGGTSIGNLQNYTISRLLEACFLCISMRERIANAYWIILVLYLLFFNANTELKQQSRVIITEKPTLYMKKRTIRKSSKLGLYYNRSASTQTLILSGATETNLGPAYKN